jgi:DNA-directed RNA polymerase I subunit RPA2
MNQEILLPGQIYVGLLCEKLQDILIISKARMIKDGKTNPSKVKDMNYIKKALITQALSVGKKLEYFLATGNLISHSNLDLQQTTGFAIVADKLNHVRYLSHFRSIHRGQYFTEMKTTAVRKLLPESWGFISCSYS